MTIATVTEASPSDLLKTIAGPLMPGEKVAQAIARAARACGLKPARAKAYWYDEVSAPRAREIDAIREVAANRGAVATPGGFLAMSATSGVSGGVGDDFLAELRAIRARLDELAGLMAAAPVDRAGLSQDR